VADFYLRHDFPAGDIQGAQGLLHLAGEIAAGASTGDIYRQREGRTTLRFERGGRHYFIKLHTGVGWREVAKNLAQGRAPVTGAANEFRALGALAAAGVDVPGVAAYASLGGSPAARRSVIVTDALHNTISLEEVCASWSEQPPAPALRIALVRELARIARAMHGAGVNHRDFYLCHFHVDRDSLARGRPRCFLIDLHRAGLRRAVPARWRVKDLGGLYFSARDAAPTRRDRLRFMRHYSPGGLRAALDGESRLWHAVAVKASQLCAKTNVPAPDSSV